ncbi:citrate/2-methylcitrate synthase [Ornithinibacillus halophilus]|uniref:Citrate synthase n=1 Tax=Ornithinibacillus halophilus TaxID=930117 RepID=A0A1M5CJ16_9BACI|nr:citrate/2-methylcitrate synthase [Ornithinibacillus halophilus]SHF54743.1 citrate synthase [Ornithinibacillus halophilus]
MEQPGLKGVTILETKISEIDGGKGTLSYRGIAVDEIVENYTFEQTAFFLLFGTFPSKSELENFEKKLIHYRVMPDYMVRILSELPREQPMMDVLRTMVSAMTLKTSDTTEQSIQLIAILPTIIAYRYRYINDLPFIEPNKELGHVANFMYMLKDNDNSNYAKILETYLIITMEHGLNASTFSARVTVSTESDLISAITSAIGTMKGPLHGGAPSGVIQLLESIKTEEQISETIHKKLENGERIMGFGHRVYKTMDPRAEALKNTINQLDNTPNWMSLALQTEIETINILKKLKPNHQLYTNVEYYAAAIMKTIEIDESLFTAIFSSSRIVGWCAHVLEQSNNNTIYRPNAKYVGN